MASLTINTGVVVLDIFHADSDECRGQFKFNPDDIQLARRLIDLKDKFSTASKDFKSKSEKCVTEKDEADLILEISNFFIGQIDELFGEGSCELLFGETRTLGMFKDFFDGITPYFNKASKKRVSKYAG